VVVKEAVISLVVYERHANPCRNLLFSCLYSLCLYIQPPPAPALLLLVTLRPPLPASSSTPHTISDPPSSTHSAACSQPPATAFKTTSVHSPITCISLQNSWKLVVFSAHAMNLPPHGGLTRFVVASKEKLEFAHAGPSEKATGLRLDAGTLGPYSMPE